MEILVTPSVEEIHLGILGVMRGAPAKPDRSLLRRAKESYKEVLRLDPSNSFAQVNLALALLDSDPVTLDLLNEALDLLEQAASDPRSHPGAHKNLGIAYYLKRNLLHEASKNEAASEASEEAERALRTYLAFQPSDESAKALLEQLTVAKSAKEN